MLHIRMICPADAPLLADYYQRNLTHFQPWEPLRSADYYAESAIQQRLQHELALQQRGEAAYFIALSDVPAAAPDVQQAQNQQHLAPASILAETSATSAQPTMRIVAHCALTHVIYGPLQSCFMGYGVDQAYQGRGIMPRLCQAAITYGFSTLQLNRIMANVMLHNHRSTALLQRLGFVEEGIAQKYLCIQGQWQDHRMIALLHPRHVASAPDNVKTSV